MKRISKCSSKAGFTLLEVLLATAILVITSSMIMRGFIAVMIFGRNNRLYSKYGAVNYRVAMSEVVTSGATNSNQNAYIVGTADTQFLVLEASQTDTSHQSNTACPNLYVDVHSYSTQDLGVNHVIDGAQVDTATVASNRIAFFYDFGDFCRVGLERDPHGNDAHVMRWGFTMDEDGNKTYGWYCFNPDHTGSCRTDAKPQPSGT